MSAKAITITNLTASSSPAAAGSGPGRPAMMGASSGFRPQYKPQQQFPRRERLFDGLEPQQRVRPPGVSTLSVSASRLSTGGGTITTATTAARSSPLHSPSYSSASTSPTASEASSSSCCPKCGFDTPASSTASSPVSATSPTTCAGGRCSAVLADAKAQIGDLQTQVRRLTEKAFEDVEKRASYEEELGKLRRALRNSTAAAAVPASSSAASLVGSLWGGNGSNSNNNTLATKPSMQRSPTDPMADRLLVALSKEEHRRKDGDATLEELLVALTREQQLRAAAEARELDASREVEELSASLFEEANEMVATERRDKAALEGRVVGLEARNAELEGRVAELEQAGAELEGRAAGLAERNVLLESQSRELKVRDDETRQRLEARIEELEERNAMLHRRDEEKRNRLERLELAVERIERVKELLAEEI
ncbi:hypothetical protein RB600_010364 [Gaeumannomyces tritici]